MLAAFASWKDDQVFLVELPEKVIQIGTRDGGFAKGKEGIDRPAKPGDPGLTAPTIRVNGELFFKGLYTGPNAQVEYRLDQKYRRFKAKVAVVGSGGFGGDTTVAFTVIGDGPSCGDRNPSRSLPRSKFKRLMKRLY